MTNFDFRFSRVVKGWFETIVLNDKFGSTEEGHDGTFTDTGVSDHDDSILILIIDRYGFDTSVNEYFKFVKINRV